MGKLHAHGLSVARGLALLAALGGAVHLARGDVQPSDGLLAEGTPDLATQSLMDGVYAVLDEGYAERAVGSDACEVVRGDAQPPKVWSVDTPEASSVFLWTQFADGSTSLGTGTVVAGSDAGQGNRLLTAAHVVDEAGLANRDPSRVLAFGQDGVLLVSLAVVVKGEHRALDRNQTIQDVRQDVAVLEPVVWFGADKSAWNAMGAPLAQDVPVDGMILGQPEGTALLEPGSSGGAVFDAKGTVAAVVIQSLSAPKHAKEGDGMPFLDALRAQHTEDSSLVGSLAAFADQRVLEGVPEKQGNPGLAVPVMGPVRAALGAEAFVDRSTAPFEGRLAVFPSGECRLGTVDAYPRFEADRLADARNEPLPEARPVSPARAWALLQGLGWYPEGLDARVKWQALSLHVEDGRQVTAEHLDPLLALAKAQDGRVGFEARRIASGVEAYAELQARHQSKEAPQPTLARVSDIRSSIGD